MASRRTLMTGGGALALLALAGCAPPGGPAGPGTVTVTATGAAGMNPGPDGSDRPLTLTLVQLRDPAAFEGVDFFTLQDPAAALGADLLATSQIALAPGGDATAAVEIDPAATALGVVAGFRDPAGKAFRATVPIAPGTDLGLAVAVSAGGLTVGPA